MSIRTERAELLEKARAALNSVEYTSGKEEPELYEALVAFADMLRELAAAKDGG